MHPFKPLKEPYGSTETETHLFVLFHIDAFQLAQSDQISPYKDTQLLPLLLSLFSVPTVSLMLHPHPQFIHLGKIQQDKVNGVINVSSHLFPKSNRKPHWLVTQSLTDNEIL